MTESERVAVLLDLLGRKVRVVLDADVDLRGVTASLSAHSLMGQFLEWREATRSAVAMLDPRMLPAQS